MGWRDPPAEALGEYVSRKGFSNLFHWRKPMVISWSSRIKSDNRMRDQFLHLINDEKVAEGRIEKTVAGRFGIDTFGIGVDTSAPVTFDYIPPFAYNVEIKWVNVELTD